MKVEFRRIDVIISKPGFGPDELAKVILCWEIRSIRTDADLVTFAVERSLTPAFDSNDVTSLVENIPGVPGQVSYTFSDVTPSLVSHWRRYFYRIRATSPSGVFVSDARTFESNPRPFEIEIISRHDFLLKNHTGTPTFSFIERTADSHPCICVDQTTGRLKKSNCKLCLNTGRQRPFFDPILHYVDYNPPEELVQIASFGETQTKMIDCWFSAFPALKPGDLLYQVIKGTLWRIVKKTPVGGQDVAIQQVCRLIAVDLSDVEYKKLPDMVPEAEMLSAIAEWEEIKQERLW